MSENQDLIKVETAISAMAKIRVKLNALTDKYKGVVFQVGTAEGMKDAKAALKLCREPRIEIERERMDAKRWLLGIGKKLDAQAAEITADFDAIELPIKRQIDTEERRLADEKEARIKAEADRVATIKQRIEFLRTAPLRAAGKKVDGIEAVQRDHSHAWAPGTYGEFEEEALRVFNETGTELGRIHQERFDFEVQQAELARQKVEQDERDRAALEQRNRDEAAERERRKAERDEEERQRRETQDAHDRQMAADRQRLADEQAEFDRKRAAQEQADRDAESARKKKLEAARADTRETVIMVVGGHFGISDAAAEALIKEAFGLNA